MNKKLTTKKLSLNKETLREVTGAFTVIQTIVISACAGTCTCFTNCGCPVVTNKCLGGGTGFCGATGPACDSWNSQTAVGCRC